MLASGGAGSCLSGRQVHVRGMFKHSCELRL